MPWGFFMRRSLRSSFPVKPALSEVMVWVSVSFAVQTRSGTSDGSVREGSPRCFLSVLCRIALRPPRFKLLILILKKQCPNPPHCPPAHQELRPPACGLRIRTSLRRSTILRCVPCAHRPENRLRLQPAPALRRFPPAVCALLRGQVSW